MCGRTSLYISSCLCCSASIAACWASMASIAACWASMAAFRTQSKIKYAMGRHQCREILKTKRSSLGAVRLVTMNGAPEEPCIGGRSRIHQLRGGRSRIHQLQGDRSRKLQVARIRILRIQRQVNPLAISWQARESRPKLICDGSYYLDCSHSPKKWW